MNPHLLPRSLLAVSGAPPQRRTAPTMTGNLAGKFFAVNENKNPRPRSSQGKGGYEVTKPDKASALHKT